MLLLLSLPAALAASVELNPGDDVAALTASLAAGDEILFNPGTYPIASYLDWHGKGSESQPIVLKAKGGEVILEFSGSNEILYLHDAQYLRIDGITFAMTSDNTNGPYAMYMADTSHVSITNCVFGPAYHGVYIDGDNTDLAFEHNEVMGTTDGHGVYIGCSDASCWTQDSTFLNNWIHDLGGSYAYGLYLANGGQGNTIADNVIYNVAYRGMAVNSTESGDVNLVEGNAIWNIGETGLLVRGGSIVQNNVIFNTTTGAGLYSGDNERGTLAYASISHNTVYNTGGYAGYVESWAGREGMVLANNAFCNPTGYGLYAADAGIDADNYISHNVVTGLVQHFELYDGTDTPIIPGGGALDFLDPEGWNFYPSASSALVNAADPGSAAFVPPDDFNGAARNGESPDAGAYERSGDQNPGWLLQEGYKTVGELNDGDDDVVGGGCCGKKGSAEEALLLLPFASFFALRARRR